MSRGYEPELMLGNSRRRRPLRRANSDGQLPLTAESLLDQIESIPPEPPDLTEEEADEIVRQHHQQLPRGNEPVPHEYTYSAVTKKKYVLLTKEGGYQANTLRRLIFELVKKKVIEAVFGD